VSDTFCSLLETVESGKARVGVVGLGHAGLPLACAFVGAGFRVLGFDTDPGKVVRLRCGQSPLGHVPAGDIAGMRARGFEATGHLDRLAEPDALVICVPTPLAEGGEPDLNQVYLAARACAGRLRPGQLVVLESTTYPGTTRRFVLPLLEESGLRAGEDFFLAYSPEREDPGNASFSTGSIPRVVGATDPRSLELACALFARVAQRVVPVSTAEAAEAAKLLENTYRAVNIALVNELKVTLDGMGIDVWEVVEAARTKPFGFEAFYPGPGVGGDCIPVAPHYLRWAARRHGLPTRMIDLAGEINAAMPAHVAGVLTDALADRGKVLRGSRVALLGVAYKRDVGDCRGSPALALMELLCRKAAVVCYHDPHVPELPPSPLHPHARGQSQPLTADFLAGQDAVVIVTDHTCLDWEWVVEHSPLVIDTRNATRGVPGRREKVVRA
jgi:UDP-N-acetyl-D-glucosamine dehydrogenase